ncbi:hypothetical protein SDC9_154686 [bioreactor metagenome]|uniref:Uncharacterized protein n=1 Tax=bioreactor metagenome TaxID=1076179 RepID=A0A645F166_9ZZZZ
MVIQIDDLLLPASLECSEELFNRDTTARTVSGRLITKLDPAEKWRVSVLFETDTLALSYQASFYTKCLAMRQTAKNIVFISPYDGTEKTISAKCISRLTPQAVNLYVGAPQVYSKIGAVFEEI